MAPCNPLLGVIPACTLCCRSLEDRVPDRELPCNGNGICRVRSQVPVDLVPVDILDHIPAMVDGTPDATSMDEPYARHKDGRYLSGPAGQEHVEGSRCADSQSPVPARVVERQVYTCRVGDF